MTLYQGIAEGLFDLFYLSSVITMGVLMVCKEPSKSILWRFGVMAITLGVGDSFHLVPRVYGLLTTGLSDVYVALNLGKMITSITMTLFYLMLYHIYLMRYKRGEKCGLTPIIYLLALLRVFLTVLPQNQWFSQESSYLWGIYRNIPFTLMGGIIIILFAKDARGANDPFKKMWVAISLSFLFYIPVVLFAQSYPLVGTLMIPKTIAYLWIVRMGYGAHIRGGLPELESPQIH